MSKRLHCRHPLLVGMLMLIMLFISNVPAANAQQATKYDWFGWGVKVDFQNSAWKVDYITYLGVNSPSPKIVKEQVKDISADCEQGGAGTLSYPTAESAYFNGNVYLRCELPSVRDALVELGYTPPGDGSFCICTLGGAPFWVDGEVRQLNTLGTMPLLDVGSRGVRVNLLVSGGTARTRLEVTRTPPSGPITYTSPDWPIDMVGNRTLAGWGGKKLVMVADHFNWLDYLADAGWRPFFQNNVQGRTIGSWNESSTTTVSDTRTFTGNYRMSMSAGTLYVGYNPSANTYFTGEIETIGVDPGCSGT